MTTNSEQDRDDGSIEYDEREAVAVFDSEPLLHAAVDSLMQIGLRQEDMSVLGSFGRSGSSAVLADADDAPRTNFITQDSRTIGLASIAGSPALIAGLGAALLTGAGGAALIPAIAVTLGSTGVAGGLGMILARAFGRKHAAFVEQQIRNGGLLLWVRASDPSRDGDVLRILKGNGGRDVHFHTVRRSWGIADVPFHDVNPDPFLKG